ncbi:hypothetical protein Tco_1026068 [Tanacetum coccineum]
MKPKDILSTCSDSEEQKMQQIQDKAKESCMVSFRLLHSHLKVLSNNDLKGTQIEGGFKRAFATLFDQDAQTFTGTILLNLDQLEKQLDKEEFQEIKSFDAFRVLMTQFQTFINSRLSFDNDDGLMIRKYFIAYIRTDVQQFRVTLIQHMESIKKSIDKRAQHKREYNSRVNERQMQSKEGKVNSSKALDANIRPVNDQVPFVELQLTAQHNLLANEQQHSVQSEPIYDTHLLENVDSNTTPESINMCHRGGEIDENAENFQVTKLKYQNQASKFGQHGQVLNEKSNKAKIKKEIEVLETINIELEHSVAKLLAENEKLHKENVHLKQTYKDLYDSIKKTRVQKKDHNDLLIVQINSKTIENDDLKAQIREKVFANPALKNELRKLKGNSVDTKFAKPSILGKSILQPPRNQLVVRQSNAFKSERPNFSKPQFASQVDVNEVLSKPVTPHYLSKV